MHQRLCTSEFTRTNYQGILKGLCFKGLDVTQCNTFDFAIDLEEYPYPHAQLVESCLWLQYQGWLEAKACYDYMVNLRENQYHPLRILILYSRVLECISHMCDSFTKNFDTTCIAYLEVDPKN